MVQNEAQGTRAAIGDQSCARADCREDSDLDDGDNNASDEKLEKSRGSRVMPFLCLMH